MDTSTKQAIELLVLHNGTCSVPSDTALAKAFMELQKVGLVTFCNSSTAGMVDVRIFNHMTAYQKGIEGSSRSASK